MKPSDRSTAVGPASPAPWCSEDWADARVREAAHEVAGSVEGSLGLATRLEPIARSMGRDTWPVLAALATLGAVDLTTARVVEPHWDAVAILEQAGDAGPGAPSGATWGVYAAAPPGPGLAASRSPGGTWQLSGTKQWCSLADRVSHALVTADVAGEGPGLFAVSLHDPGVSVDAAAWVSRGLRDVTTSTVVLSDVPASPVGPPGWYLDRPGFAWGGMGVAAVWFGGAAALAGALWHAAGRREPDQVALLQLGACDVLLHGALLALRDAAAAVDGGRAEGVAGRLLAARVRAQVAACAEEVLTRVGHALGPGPLALDAEHAARVADLTVYLRQHHAERDLAALGRLALTRSDGSTT